MKIGVLALQGAFREHEEAFGRIGVETLQVRLPEDLRKCDGLVLPGGETTAQRKLAQAHGLWEGLAEFGRSGRPILGTCAGLILLARKVDGLEGLSLNLLDVDVLRNAYGRQVFSFETRLPAYRTGAPILNGVPFQAIFIRAPRISRVGPKVSVLFDLEGEPVAVRQGSCMGLAFHPELTYDDRIHMYFLELVRTARPDGDPS